MSDTLPTPAKLYLAYGSNLSSTQMSLRCPSSTNIGIARLPHYRWIINTRGYANIVASQPLFVNRHEGDEEEVGKTDEVWGLIYELDATDEKILDVYEGVPRAYGKHILEAEVWFSSNEDVVGKRVGEKEPKTMAKVEVLGKAKPQHQRVLVYIDALRTTSGIPKDEYILRMRRGIREGMELGLPWEWVQSVIGKYISLEEDKEAI